MRDLNVIHVPRTALRPYPHNARRHSNKQLRQIADSIQQFGWTNPILIDDTHQILAGHGRFEAAKLLGLSTVPTLRIADMTEAQKRAYILADNKIAENADWDEAILASEFKALIEIDPTFDLSLTGFDPIEIDLVLADSEEADDEADNSPSPAYEVPASTQLGDQWSLGPHRLICGNALVRADYDLLLAGNRAQMVFIDPPYNVPIDKHVSGLGQIKHREFVMASGEMSEADFTSFLTCAFRELARVSVDGALHFICMDWRHAYELLSASREVYSEQKNLCVWAKSNGGMGSLYRSQHELVFVFKHGTAPHINNVALGQYGRNRTNVWHYAGMNSFSAARSDDLALHPTVKPVALVADAIYDCSRRGGRVIDVFGGSGTTLIAAEQTGRVAHVMELDPRYVDVAVRRWQTLTGEAVRHVVSGDTFDTIAAERLHRGHAMEGHADE